MSKHTPFRPDKNRRTWLAARSILASTAFGLAGTIPGHAEELTATVSSPIIIADPAELAPDTTIAWGQNHARVEVNGPIDQGLIDRIVPLSSPVDQGRLVLGASTTSDLDFTGKGDIALSANSAGINFSGAWTPSANNYRVQYGALTLGGTNQLTGARSFEIDGAILKITGTHTYSGGTSLGNLSKVAIDHTTSLGSGGIALSNGTRLLANFAVTQDFIDRISAPTDENQYAVLYLGANTSADLDFTGAGQVALSGAINSTTVFSGAWTPSDNVYRISQEESNSVFDSNNWNPSRPTFLALTRTNALTDGESTARRLEVIGYTGMDGVVTLHAANNYTGGTLVKGGQLSATHSAALGTGDVVVSADGFLDIQASVANKITASRGNIIIDSTSPTTGEIILGDESLLTVWGKSGGVVTLSGGSRVHMNNVDAVFSGALNFTPNSGSILQFEEGLIQTNLTVTAGNTLLIQTNGFDSTHYETNPSGMFGDLTLSNNATLANKNGSLYFGGNDRLVTLNNAWFDVQESFGETVPDSWLGLSADTTLEYLLMAIGYGQTGTITGSLRAANQLEGYNVSFMIRDQRELWAVVSLAAVPEPSTYAMIFGLTVLVGAICRNRRGRRHAKINA